MSQKAPFTLGIAVLAVFLILAACPSTPAPKRSVIFTIAIPVELFSPDTTLQISLANAEMLALEEKQPVCWVSSQTRQPICPPGTVYQPITHERFSIPVRDIEKTITVSSNTTYVGERYEIGVGGQSADECNSTSARFEGVATAHEMSLSTAVWGTTEMACIKNAGYTVADFTKGLEAAGNRVADTGDLIDQGFPIKGIRILVNDEDVYVYTFDSPQAADAAAALVSPNGYTITMLYGKHTDGNPTGVVAIERHNDWLKTPHFFKRDRLIVIYAGDTVHLTATIEKLLGQQFAGG